MKLRKKKPEAHGRHRRPRAACAPTLDRGHVAVRRAVAVGAAPRRRPAGPGGHRRPRGVPRPAARRGSGAPADPRDPRCIARRSRASIQHHGAGDQEPLAPCAAASCASFSTRSCAGSRRWSIGRTTTTRTTHRPRRGLSQARDADRRLRRRPAARHDEGRRRRSTCRSARPAWRSSGSTASRPKPRARCS